MIQKILDFIRSLRPEYTTMPLEEGMAIIEQAEIDYELRKINSLLSVCDVPTDISIDIKGRTITFSIKMKRDKL